MDVKKAHLYKEVGIFAAIKADKMLHGAGEILRPRQEAANLFPAALRGGGKSCPPYAPFFPPKMGEAPWAPQGPAFKRAAGAGKARQQRDDVKTSFLNSGQLALSDMRYFVAREIAGDWGHFGALGAFFANLAHFMEISIIENMGTVSRFERAQSASWSHLVRERGGLQLAKEELIKINRDRVCWRVSDQSIEFNERKKVQDGRISNYRSGRHRRPKCPPFRKRPDSSARAPKRGRYSRSKYSDASNAAKDAK